MTAFDHEIEIAAPVDYVFEWGITPENWQRSTPALLDFEVVEETDDGTRYRNTFKLLGRTATSDEVFTVDADSYRTVSVFDDGDMSGEMRFDYIETGDGTHIRLHGDLETGTSLFERAIQPVLTRSMNRQFRNTLRTMKKLVEAEYAAEARDAVAA